MRLPDKNDNKIKSQQQALITANSQCLLYSLPDKI